MSELSRLGRSLGQVIHIVDELVKRKIRFTTIKESIHFEGKIIRPAGILFPSFIIFVKILGNVREWDFGSVGALRH